MDQINIEITNLNKKSETWETSLNSLTHEEVCRHKFMSEVETFSKFVRTNNELLLKDDPEQEKFYHERNKQIVLEIGEIKKELFELDIIKSNLTYINDKDYQDNLIKSAQRPISLSQNSVYERNRGIVSELGTIKIELSVLDMNKKEYANTLTELDITSLQQQLDAVKNEISNLDKIKI